MYEYYERFACQSSTYAERLALDGRAIALVSFGQPGKANRFLDHPFCLLCSVVEFSQ